MCAPTSTARALTAPPRPPRAACSQRLMLATRCGSESVAPHGGAGWRKGVILGEYDAVVGGAREAGRGAALAAQEQGARVLVLEAAPFDERGGNSRYT